MAMRYQKALRGLLLSIIVTASIFVGLSAISQKSTDQRTCAVLQHETMPMASDAASNPTWDLVNHTRLAIDTQSAPFSYGNTSGVPGVSISVNRTHNKAHSLNATNLQHYMNLSYTDRFTINCTSIETSTYTIKIFTPLIHELLKDLFLPNASLVTNIQSIKIKCTTNETSFTYNLSMYNSWLFPIVISPIYSDVSIIQFRYALQYFYFNISQAVKVLESRSIYEGASFLFEVNYTVPVVFSSWAMATKTGEKFRIEGDHSSSLSNYTLSFRVSAPKGVSITFHYLPADYYYINQTTPIFYRFNGSVPIAFNAAKDEALQGWLIAPNGLPVDLNSSGIPFRIDFSINATVGFIDQLAGRWTSDGMASDMDIRTRKFKLTVLSGPNTLLIENVEFTANDIAYTNRIKPTSSTTPESGIDITDDTYTYYDTVLEKDVTKSNGTKVKVGRIQKSNGPVKVSFSYDAPYNASLTIRDNVRNPLPGAEVILFFHGVRFGPLMSMNGSNLQPAKIADALGVVTYNFLPEGNYSVEVRFQDRVTTQEFSLYGGTKSVSIEVVTDAPYQPWILIAWIAIFGVLCMLGISLFKRKR